MTTPAARPGGHRGDHALTDGLAGGIARLRRAMRRGARVASPANLLAVTQLELLSALAEHPGARPGQLAQVLHMRPGTVTTIVKALTDQGMVARATPNGDRRTVALALTDSGRRAVHAWQATNATVLHLALSTLPVSQRRALAKAVPALAALATAVDRLADTATPPTESSPLNNLRCLAATAPQWTPTRAWRAAARLAAQLAIVMLSVHRNAELVAAGLLAAGTAITAHAEARFRALRARPSDLANVLAWALALAAILMWLLSLAPRTRLH